MNMLYLYIYLLGKSEFEKKLEKTSLSLECFFLLTWKLNKHFVRVNITENEKEYKKI